MQNRHERFFHSACILVAVTTIPARAQTQSVPPVTMPAPKRELTPRDLTQPNTILTCKIADEKQRWVHVIFRRIGERGSYLIRKNGEKDLGLENARYEISSPDPRLAGVEQEENLHDVKGVAFKGSDGRQVVAQLDEYVVARRKQGILNLYVSENNHATRLIRYTGFCEAEYVAQEPGPDRPAPY